MRGLLSIGLDSSHFPYGFILVSIRFFLFNQIYELAKFSRSPPIKKRKSPPGFYLNQHSQQLLYWELSNSRRRVTFGRFWYFPQCWGSCCFLLNSASSWFSEREVQFFTLYRILLCSVCVVILYFKLTQGLSP